MNEGEEAIHRQRVQRQTKQDIGRKKNQMRGAPYLEETDQAGYSEVENQNVERQTSYLSKDLRDRNFGPQKFTQKKGNLR